MRRSGYPAFGCAFALCVVFFGPLHQSRFPKPMIFNLFGYSLIGAAAAFAVICLVLFEKGMMASVFSVWPLTRLGRISYGLYLYQITVVVQVQLWAAKHGFHHPRQVNLVALPLVLALAALSFRFLERPFLQFGRKKVGEYKAPPMPLKIAA